MNNDISLKSADIVEFTVCLVVAASTTESTTVRSVFFSCCAFETQWEIMRVCENYGTSKIVCVHSGPLLYLSAGAVGAQQSHSVNNKYVVWLIESEVVKIDSDKINIWICLSAANILNTLSLEWLCLFQIAQHLKDKALRLPSYLPELWTINSICFPTVCSDWKNNGASHPTSPLTFCISLSEKWGILKRIPHLSWVWSVTTTPVPLHLLTPDALDSWTTPSRGRALLCPSSCH